MKPKRRQIYTEEQKVLMWDHWQVARDHAADTCDLRHLIAKNPF